MNNNDEINASLNQPLVYICNIDCNGIAFYNNLFT